MKHLAVPTIKSMSKDVVSHYELRNLQRLDYREQDDETSLDDDDTLLAGDVNISHQSCSLLDDTCSADTEVYSLPSCSTPIDRKCFSTVISDFQPSVTTSLVEDSVSSEQALVYEELIETIGQLSLSSVGDSTESFIVPSAEGSIMINDIVEVSNNPVEENGSCAEGVVDRRQDIASNVLIEEVSDTDMAAVQLRRLAVDEIHEEMDMLE